MLHLGGRCLRRRRDEPSAVIWKYLGTLAGLERRWLRRSSSTMHNIASSSRLAILAQSSPRLLTYFQNTALDEKSQRDGRDDDRHGQPGDDTRDARAARDHF